FRAAGGHAAVQRLRRCRRLPVSRHGPAQELLMAAAVDKRPGTGGRRPHGRPSARMEHAVLNVCVHGLGVYPAVRWAVLGFTTGWGANPQEFLTWSSGI